MAEKLIIGYEAASNFTGIPAKRLQRMVGSRAIRVVKFNKRSVAFYPSRLEADLKAMEVQKI